MMPRRHRLPCRHHQHVPHRCHRHCHCHCAGKQGTGDDAKASPHALLLLLMHMSVRHCRRHRAGKQGTGDDAEASFSALLPSLTCTSILAAAAEAIVWANKGQLMIPRHNCLPCCRLIALCRLLRHRCCHRAGKQGTSDDAKASSPALLMSSTRTSVCCCHCHCAGKQGTGDDAEASLSTL